MLLLQYGDLFFSKMFMGGTWALVISIAFILAELLFVSFDKPGWTFSIFVAYAVEMAVFQNINLATFIWAHPVDVAQFAIMYFVVGGLYSVLKFWANAREKLREVRDIKKMYLEKYPEIRININEPIPSECSRNWLNHLKDKLPGSDYEFVVERKLSPGAIKDLIIVWITFWPFSALGLFVARPLDRIGKFVYNSLVDVYHKIRLATIKRFINIEDLSLR